MAIEDLVYDRLNDDAELTALLPGGLYIHLSELSLNLEDTPEAFDSTTQLLRACGVVTGRAVTPMSAPRDMAFQFVPFQQVVEIWLYNHKDADYPEAQKQRVFELLEGCRLDGVFQVQLVNEVKTRAPELGGAVLFKVDYEVTSHYGGVIT